MAEITAGKKESMTKALLRASDGSTAEVYTHGAHVTSWKNAAGEEQIFVSDLALFSPPTAIRGGIPICWPQFGDMGPCKAQHGFARNSEFQITDSTENSVTMELKGASGQFSEFPTPFCLVSKVSLSPGTLEQELQVHNLSESDSFAFTAALHTYFRLQHGISNAAINGLHSTTYLDNLQARKECTETAEKVVFEGEIDRIYCGAPTKLEILDGGRKVVVEKANFPDAVIWNPHIAKAASMKDFGDDEWKDMMCVEVAQAGSGAVEVKPGQTWTARQMLRC